MTFRQLQYYAAQPSTNAVAHYVRAPTCRA